MGAWGYGVFDNDTGLDVRDRFADIVKKHEYAFDAVIQLEKDYANDMDEVNVATVVAYIAIGFGSLTKSVKEQTMKVIDEEIEHGADEWNEPEKRREQLQAFRTYLASIETVERTNLDN